MGWCIELRQQIRTRTPRIRKIQLTDPWNGFGAGFEEDAKSDALTGLAGGRGAIIRGASGELICFTELVYRCFKLLGLTYIPLVGLPRILNILNSEEIIGRTRLVSSQEVAH